MLIFYVTLFIPALNSAIAVDHKPSASSFVTAKRGIVEAGHAAPQDYKFRQSKPSNSNARSNHSNNSKSLAYYKNVKAASPEASLVGSSGYEDVFKQPYAGLPSPVLSEAQTNEQSSPYYRNLFTMSAGYKVANEDKPLKQIGLHSHQSNDGYSSNQGAQNQNAARGVYSVVSSSNIQTPVYKTTYPLPKASGSHVPAYQSSLYTKKPSQPTLHVQNLQQQPAYFTNFQSQPIVLNPVDPRFTFSARAPKVTNVQLSAPFLSPLSSFQGQVVPISTAGSSPQFPQYKGAAIEVYPTVGGFPTAGYEPLQTQPQLHFGHGNIQNVQTVVGRRPAAPVQEIRSDVEIINRKKPTTPPPRKDDDDDEDEEDEGYSPSDKDYGPNTQDDDEYESKPEKSFKSPRTEGDFKPSKSFPFKQYDSTFGRYSNRDRDEETDEKPFTKYREYSSSNDDDDEDTPSGRYHSEDTSSKPYYSKQDDEEEEDDRRGYDRQKTEESSDYKYRPKYFEKDFDEEFETSYRKEVPKQSYVHRKEVSDVDYGSRSSRRNKENDESDDSSGQGSRASFKYHRTPQGIRDSDGQSSDIVAEVAYEGAFGYKTPESIRSYKHRMATSNGGERVV